MSTGSDRLKLGVLPDKGRLLKDKADTLLEKLKNTKIRAIALIPNW